MLRSCNHLHFLFYVERYFCSSGKIGSLSADVNSPSLREALGDSASRSEGELTFAGRLQNGSVGIKNAKKTIPS